MTGKGISTFWAGRIRFGLIAGRAPLMWPVYLFLPATRRAFDRSFRNRKPGWVSAGLRDGARYRADMEAYTAVVKTHLRFWERTDEGITR